MKHILYLLLYILSGLIYLIWNFKFRKKSYCEFIDDFRYDLRINGFGF